MKKIKTLALCLIACLFLTTHAKAISGPNGPNGIIIWPVYNGSIGTSIPSYISGPTGVVIWPIIQGSAQANTGFLPEQEINDCNDGSNVNSIVVTNGEFRYAADQGSMNTAVDVSNWPTGTYQVAVTFNDGTVGNFGFRFESE